MLEPKAEPAHFTIVRLEREDDLLDGVLKIDAESFLKPWTRAMYVSEAGNRDTSHVYVLSTADGSVAAYCAFWLVVDEVHIHNLATRPLYRRQGFGAALIRHALRVGRSRGAHRATLEVRVSNRAARELYTRLGFLEGLVRMAYYTKPVEDALVLWRNDR
jgi:ribosomal-protein-alanine N-acetyltransferase